MNAGATTAVTTAVNATIIAVVQEQRRRALAQFNDQHALSPETAIARATLDPSLQSTVDQLRAQGIIRDRDDTHSYLDAAALLSHEKKLAKGGRIALAVLVPVLIAVAVALVVAVTASR